MGIEFFLRGLSKTLLFVVMIGLAFSRSALAQQQVDPHDRQAITFYFEPSPSQDKALDRYAHADLQKAEKAGHPVLARTAFLPAMIIISLESVALCDLVRGCPLLVFRDITKAPTLQDYSYQNISIGFDDRGTLLYLRSRGPDKECVIPKIGRGRCGSVRKKKA